MVLAGLTAYLAGAERRLRAAGLAQAKAEARAAEERKRRVLTVALAASVLATGLLGAGGWAWVTRDRLRVASRRRASRSTRPSTTPPGSGSRPGPRPAATRPCGSRRSRRPDGPRPCCPGGEGSPELRDRVRSVLAAIERERDEAEAAEKDRRMVERLAEIHNDLGVHGDTERADAEYAAAFRGYGVDLDAARPGRGGSPARRQPGRGRAGQRPGPVGLHPQDAASAGRGRGASGSSRSPRRRTPTPGGTGSATPSAG